MLGVAGLAALMLVSACTGSTTQSPTTSAPPSPTAPCPEGTSTLPPQISNLSVDGVTARTFRKIMIVPYAGLDTGTPEQPSVVRIEVQTDTSGAPVTFTAPGAGLIESLEDNWLEAPDQLTVFSVPGTGLCLASVYLLSTETGSITVTAQGQSVESTTIPVTTVPASARFVRARLAPTSVLAGDSSSVTVSVTDVFGNPVQGVGIDLQVPRRGPARFATGSDRTTLITDSSGRASIDISTRAGQGTEATVTVRSDVRDCQPLLSQTRCGIDEPIPGAAPGRARQEVDLTVTQPSVTLTRPAAGTAYSSGQTFTVAARTTGVPLGTLAQVQIGDSVVALSNVRDDGAIEIADVPAQVTNAGYFLVVAGVKRVPIGISVRSFSLLTYTLDEDRLLFDVATGAWPQGTKIVLTRDGAEVKRRSVQAQGRNLEIVAPYVPGLYQVQVRSGGRDVRGEQPLLVL